VPPVLAKDFSPPFLRKTWRRVYRAISQAAHLYVIGYSLPPEDRFARLVLGRAIRNNRLAAKRNKTKPLTLTVVNPDEAVQTTFIKLFGESESKYLYYQTSFATLIAAAESDEIDFPQH